MPWNLPRRICKPNHLSRSKNILTVLVQNAENLWMVQIPPVLTAVLTINRHYIHMRLPQQRAGISGLARNAEKKIPKQPTTARIAATTDNFFIWEDRIPNQ